MKNFSPIYSMLHHEIRTCADQLLELSQTPDVSAKNEGNYILSRLHDLLQFASKMRSEEHYQALGEFRDYVEHTMLGYQDDQKRALTMRLSEALFLLAVPPEPGIEYKASVVRSLTTHLVRHFLEEAKPGRPLFRQLNEIKKAVS